MNNTITLSALINRLAKVANTDTNTSRRFLRTFFATIEDQLSAGEAVTIKGIGTFRRSQDPTFGNPGTLQFIPDEQLAAETNAPFAMFSAVELADGVSFKDIDEPQEKLPDSEPHTTAGTFYAAEPEPSPAEEEKTDTPEEISAPVKDPEPADIPEPARPEPVVRTPLRWPEEEEEEEEIETNDDINRRNDPSEADEESEDDRTDRRRFPWWFWLGIVLLLTGGAVAGYFAAMYEPSEFETENDMEEPADSISNNIIEEIQVADLDSPDSSAKPQDETAPAQSEPEAEKPKPAPEPEVKETAGPVYDTVDVSLAKLAKKHYGNTNYWVFIYKANETSLGNPDHIARGTKVLIPSKDSFQESTDSATKAKAAKLAGEIARKFKK